MPNVGSALTQKIGPLPGYAWAAIVAGGLWFFFLRKPAATSATQNAAASGSQLSSGYGLGYAQGLQAAGPPPANAPAATAAPALNWHFGAPTSPQWVWRLTPSGTASWQQNTGAPPNFTLQPSNSPPPAWLPQYSYQVAEIPEGQTLSNYLSTGGVGGPRSIGSRSANLMHHSHPLVGARVPYQFHVRAIGGAPNHAREVHRVALQSGVHPARLMALNPTYTGYVRVA